MLPVCGKPLIGTASAFNVTFGTAAAVPVRPNRASPITATHIDALRISSLSSFDGQLRLEPGSSGAMRSGDIEIPCAQENKATTAANTNRTAKSVQGGTVAAGSA